MRNILIVNGLLVLGGAEKLVYELAIFAKRNNIRATILIPDNYNTEYYDPVFKQQNIKVIRTRIRTIKNFRSPKRMFYSAYWAFKLKFFAQKLYDSIHVIGLYNIYQAKDLIPHKNRFYWHVTNASQGAYTFPASYFDDPEDTIVCINPYQMTELDEYEKTVAIRCKKQLFKLFLND